MQTNQATESPSTPSTEEQLEAATKERDRLEKALKRTASIEAVDALEAIESKIGRLRKVIRAQEERRAEEAAKRKKRQDDAHLNELARSYVKASNDMASAIERICELDRQFCGEVGQLLAASLETSRCSRVAATIGGFLRPFSPQEARDLVARATMHRAQPGDPSLRLFIRPSDGSPACPIPAIRCEAEVKLVSVKFTTGVRFAWSETEYSAGDVVVVTEQHAAELVKHNQAEVLA